jgi:putative ABC transport system ATP-binding protein
MLISLKNITKKFPHSSGEVIAVDNVSLDVDKGESILLIGPSGSGKTTLLNMIAAIETPTSGQYEFNGNSVPYGNIDAMTRFRRENIGYIFQTFNLIRDLTALENVALVQELSGKVDLDAAKDCLRQVGLDGMENRFPFELSGGQQQRIAIARSMAKNPKVLLADEPTGNLDEKTTHEVFQTLVEMCKKNSITIIVVSHDLSLSKYTSKIIEMRSGKTVDKS